MDEEIHGISEGDIEAVPAKKDDEETQRAAELSTLTDAKLVGALLDQLDTALDTYEADTESRPHMSDDERDLLLEIIRDVRAGIDIPEGFLRGAGIKIRYKTARKQDESRLDRGEDVGINVEVDIPKQRKVVVLNVWGSRRDYESSTHFSGDMSQRSDRVIDSPRTIDFHVYKKKDGGHGFDENARLLHDARYVMFRSGHPGNMMEIMRYDGGYIQRSDRPVYITDPRISVKMNGELYAITDELYNRRGEEEGE